MKDYLKRLARGMFRYEEPKVNVDVSFNQIDVPEDSITDLSFEYTSNESVKGVIWSSNERVRLKLNIRWIHLECMRMILYQAHLRL